MIGRLAAVLGLLAGPALADPVTGSVSYQERVLLPPESVVTVRLIDTARADAPATVYAETRRLTLGGPPFLYALEVDPRLLGERRRRLQLEATIEVAGRVRMRTTEAHLLTPESFAGPVDMTVRSMDVGTDDAAPAFNCAAEGGRWTFTLSEATATLTTPTPSVGRYAGTVTRPTDDLVVWEGGPALGARLTALLQAEACADGAPWQLTLLGQGTVRRGCCTTAP